MRGAPITRLPASLELNDPRKSGASEMSSPGSKSQCCRGGAVRFHRLIDPPTRSVSESERRVRLSVPGFLNLSQSGKHLIVTETS
jgi:hypothetical protein